MIKTTAFFLLVSHLFARLKASQVKPAWEERTPLVKIRVKVVFFFLLKDFVDLFVTCNLFLKLGSFFGNWNWKCFVQLDSLTSWLNASSTKKAIKNRIKAESHYH